MADKKISYRIAIDGEAEYKRALQSLNSELKTLGTESKKLSAIYAGESNTYDALAAKSKNLANQQEALTEKITKLKDVLKKAESSLQEHKSRTAELEAAQKKANDAYNNATEKTEELIKAVIEANSAYKINQENIQYTERRIQSYSQQVNVAEGELVLLNREIDKTSDYIQEAATSFDGTAHSIDKYGNEVKDAAEDTKSFSNAADLLAQAIVASGAIEGAEKLRDAIIDTAKASIEYESAFAGVRKTVDGTAEELATISDGIKGMAAEIPLATTELAGIAEAAGQLGIQTGSILSFTEVMAQLSVTTNLSSTEAAESLAKFANITKMSESQYSNLGSSIVALGNNFATTESDIVSMATRLASTGEVVGLTEPQILAVATALSSVGIEAEAGGSAFSKLLKTIETDVETGSESVKEYARIAGMSAEEFADAWRKDAVSAVSDFIDGLGRLEGSGTSAITVLNDLGLTETRLSNVVLALASSEGLLSDALELSNTAWAENTALAEEAAVRFETTESKLQILSNAFENLKITVGDELVGKFGGAIDGLTDLTQAADEFVKKNPEIVSGLTAVAAGLGSLAVAGTVTPLISTLFTTITNNPIAIGIATVTTLAASFGTLALEASDTISAFEDQAKAAGELIEKGNELKATFAEAYKEIQTESESLETAIDKIETLGGKTDLTAQETVILQSAMNKLNGAIPGLALSYDDLGDSLDATIIKLKLLTEISGKSAESAAIESQIQAQIAHREELNASISETTEELKKAQDYLAEISEGGIQTFENGSFDLIGTIQDNVNLAVNTMFGYVGDADTAVKDLRKKLEGLKNELGSTDLNIDDLSKNKAEIDEYIADASAAAEEALNSLKDTTEETYTTVGETVEETADEVAESNTKIATSAKSTKEAIDEAGQAIIDHAKIVQTNLDALTKEYDSAYKSAQSSLGGIGGLFGEVAFTTDKSISDMISGMQTQADYFTGYMQNLQRASQIGINEGLVAALADGSDASAGYLQKIVNEFNLLATEYGENSTEAQNFIRDFNESFEASSAAKDALARTMAGITTDFEDRKGDILAQASDLVTELEGYTGNAYDEVSAAVETTVGNISTTLGKIETAISESSVKAGAAMQTMRQTVDAHLEGTDEKGREAGENYTAGLAEGIENGTSAVNKAIQKLVDDAIVGAVNKGLEIRSPSRVGMEQGEFYDEGIALGIERNTGTVTSASLEMISDLEEQSQSAAAAAGTALGNTMAQAMAEALSAGQALRKAVESGELTVDGKTVQTAASVGISSLTGQAALDWNAEQKRDFGLPDSWTNQDITDWLNAGGALSVGSSSTTQANIESAIESENSGKVSLTQTTNKAWHDSYLNQLNELNKSKSGSGGATVVVNQTFAGTTSYYDAKQGAKAGVQEATYY